MHSFYIKSNTSFFYFCLMLQTLNDLPNWLQGLSKACLTTFLSLQNNISNTPGIFFCAVLPFLLLFFLFLYFLYIFTEKETHQLQCLSS